MRINRLPQFQSLYTASRVAIVKSTAVLSIVASSAIITGCTPAIHAATSSLYKIQTGASQTTSGDHLVFIVEPTNTAANSVIGPAIEVEFVNQAGQVDTSANSVIALTIGLNPSVGILSGATAAAAVNGVATFPGLTINKVGVGYTLVASTTGLAPETSATFNIAAGSPSQLVFTTEPTSATSGASLGNITVTIEDSSGNVVTSSVAPITLAIGNNAGPGGTLSGSVTVNAVAGVATLPGLNIDVAGLAYTLVASSGSLTSVPSTAFNISANVASKLVFTTQPVSTTSGASLGSIAVTVEDSAGNKISGSSAPITLAIGNNAGPGGVLSGTLTINAVNGVATFPGLSINVNGTGYTLAATSASLTGATSSAFNISVGAATKLAFTTQPSNAASGASLGSIAVTVEDASGNKVTSSTASITLAIGTNAGPGGVLSGTQTVSAVAGVATFPGLSINIDGTGYNLTAASGSLTGATSTNFNITSSGATKVVFTTQPASAASGASLGSIAVAIEDGSGNIVTGSTAAITLAIGTNAGPGGVLSGTVTVNAVNGIATFPGLNINLSGTGYTLTAASASLAGATSSAFNIGAGTATQVVFTTQPSSAASGASLGSITAKIEDASGNVVTSSSANVTLAIGTNAGPGGVLSGTLTIGAVSGVATFPGLSINVDGTGYTLTAASASLTGATSSAFNITAAAASKLIITSQPSNAVSGATLGSIVVKIEDASGNVITSATDAVTLAIGNNAGPGGTLSGTVTINAIAGVASFSGLSIDIAGTGYTLTAVDGALTGATSSAFNITVGSASKLVFTTQPVSAASGASLGSIAVTVEDSGGNKVTSSTAPITLAIGTNAGPGGILSGTVTLNAVSGVATLPGTNINIAGVGYTLTANSGVLTGATSAAFNITAGTATKLVFTTQPTNAVTNASLGSVAVTVEDAAGNRVASSSASIVVAFGTNPSGGTLGGTLTVNASSGVATFSPLSVNFGGTGYTLQATSGTLTAATSSAFNITYPVPTSFAWSGSASPASATCQAYTIQAQNSGAPAAYGTSTAVNLTGAGLGSFYGPGDSSCGTPVASVSFGAAVSSVTIFYKNPSVGPVTLTSTAGSATGNIAINSTGLYSVTESSTTGPAGTPVLITVTLENSLGAVITAPTNLALYTNYQNNGSSFEKTCASTDPTCAGAANGNLTISSGSSSTTFYYQDTRAAPLNYDGSTGVLYVLDATGYLNGNYVTAFNFTSLNSTSGSFVITGPTFVTPGTCATYTATALDSYTNITTLNSALSVALASSAGGQFYGTTDTTCGSAALTSVPIASGASSVVFHFMDNTVSDNPILSATSSGFTAVSFNAHAVATIPTITLGGTDATGCSIVFGDLKCWGNNNGQGLVGNDASDLVSLPTQVLGLTTGVTSMSGGYAYACAVVSGGLQCWGSAGFDATGATIYEGTNPPASNSVYTAGTGVTAVGIGAGSYANTCMIVNGGVYCAGDEGGLGNGNTMSDGGNFVAVPTLGSGVTGIGGGVNEFCAIINGGLDCWGNGFGPSVTTQIVAGSGVTQVILEPYANYAIQNGALVGSFSYSDPISWGVSFGLTSGVTKLAVGYENTCVLVNGGVQCFGFGWGSTTQVIPAGSGVIDISAAGGSGCALFSTSEIKCWGDNSGSAIGNGTITDAATPVSTGSIY